MGLFDCLSDGIVPLKNSSSPTLSLDYLSKKDEDLTSWAIRCFKNLITFHFLECHSPALGFLSIRQPMSSTLILEIRTVRKRGCIVPLYERKILAPFSNLFWPFWPLYCKRLGMDCSLLAFYFYSFLQSQRRFREPHISQHWNWPSHLLGLCPEKASGMWIEYWVLQTKPAWALASHHLLKTRKFYWHIRTKATVSIKWCFPLSLLWVHVHTPYQGKTRAEPRQNSKSLDTLYSPKSQQKLLRT